jgi:uncharacterized protein (DUF58 family)
MQSRTGERAGPMSEPLAGGGINRPLTYALRWRVSGVLPGIHRGIESGQSGRFREVVAFDRAPDPRRIDLRSTVRDPFGVLHVRRFEQRAAARVEVLLDVSASMRFRGNYQLAAALIVAMARAAYEVHDGFGIRLCGERIEFTRVARRVDPAALAQQLESVNPNATSARSLLLAGRELAGRRRLVLLISDFAWPLAELATLLDSLAMHDVVPIHLFNDPTESLPAWGLIELTDLESRGRRFYLMRPSLRARWREQEAQRRAQIVHMCTARGRRPFILQRIFNPAAFADHLLSA